METREAEPLRIKDRRDDFPIFIHSELDDYGLNPVEFRVYSRLARRAGQHGKHSESVPNMAREFEVSDRTIQRALKLLIACALVARHVRPGKTDEYSLNPRSVWRNKKQLKEIREQVLFRSGDTTAGGRSGDTRTGGDMRDTGVVTQERGVVVTPQTDEGTPYEGNPSKVIPLEEVTPPFSSTEFIDALARFVQHRKEKRNRLTQTARAALFKKLKAWGEERATAALVHSTEQGWTGVYEEHSNGTYKQNSSSGRSPESDFQFKPKSIIR